MSAITQRPLEITDNTSGLSAVRPLARLVATLGALFCARRLFVPVDPCIDQPHSRKAWCRLDPA